MSYIPMVIESGKNGEKGYDIYSRLLKDRIIMLDRQVDEQSASSIVAQLLFLAKEDKKKDISLYINSPGGVVTDGMAIYDTMQYIEPDVKTICIGQAASMGAFLLSSGAKGKRHALPHSRIMIHQPLGGFQGQASDFDIHAKEIILVRERLNRIMAEHTGQPMKKIQKDTDRDNFMSGTDAVNFGLIDQVMVSRAVASDKWVFLFVWIY